MTSRGLGRGGSEASGLLSSQLPRQAPTPGSGGKGRRGRGSGRSPTTKAEALVGMVNRPLRLPRSRRRLPLGSAQMGNPPRCGTHCSGDLSERDGWVSWLERGSPRGRNREDSGGGCRLPLARLGLGLHGGRSFTTGVQSCQKPPGVDWRGMRPSQGACEGN